MKKTAVIYDKWLHQFGGAEVVACTMADILRKNGWNVTFVSGKYIHLHKIQDCFAINLKDTPFYVVWNNEKRLNEIVQGKDLFINLSFMDYSYGFARKNIYYTHFPTPERSNTFNLLLEFFHRTSLHTLLPKPFNEKVYNRIRAGIFFDMRKRLDSYDTILANSEFTKKWIKNYWDKNSDVLYPPVQPVHTTPRVEERSGKTLGVETKHKWITSVGRFFTLGHGKKQEILIKAFKKLYNKLLTTNDHRPTTNNHQPISDLELHLVGGLGSEPSSLRFLEYLKNLAKGYPIFFHINVPHSEVIEILQKSKIYWHATGYEEDEDINPIAFEHFGIAPVEAIVSGCIPVLYDGGGLREIIEKLGLSKNKHLFLTIEDLVKHTSEIIMQKSNAQQQSKKPLHLFSLQQFNKKFDEICHLI